MPIVKANAYGHGLEKVSQILEKAGAGWFGVARIEKGLRCEKRGQSTHPGFGLYRPGKGSIPFEMTLP
jgi:alanine racemase